MTEHHVIFELPNGDRVGFDVAANDPSIAIALALRVAEREAPGAVLDSIELAEAA
jgi:hypothetical protein